jgi:hypothetical protein
MFAVKGVYDGKVAKPQEAVPFSEDYEVVITFLKPSLLDTPAVDTEKQHHIPDKRGALDRLVGCMKGNTMTIEDAKNARLARQ